MVTTTIPAPDEGAFAAACARQATLTKPQGALGRLEDLACWFAARQRRAIPVPVTPAITVFAADHGVAARGVSAYPSEVTAQMVANFARGGAAINVLARALGARLTVVDVGVAAPLDALATVVQAKVRPGTADLAAAPAMTRAEAERALAVGAERAAADVAAGATLLIAGEMGIGNTTASACLVCAFGGEPPARIVGHGTGIDAATHARKVEIVAHALERARARRATASTGSPSSAASRSRRSRATSSRRRAAACRRSSTASSPPPPPWRRAPWSRASWTGSSPRTPRSSAATATRCARSGSSRSSTSPCASAKGPAPRSSSRS